MNLFYVATVAFRIAAWLVAGIWLVRTLPSIRGLHLVPNLLRLPSDCQPNGLPTLTVVVPAKDEAANIGTTLGSLLAQDYENLQIVAVNDRSSDETGTVMDRLAVEHPGRMSVKHVTALPPGWTGKVHAMTVGAQNATTDYLLFTDGDVIFRPDALRRALTEAQRSHADHFICMPTLLVHRWDEGALLAVFNVLGALAVWLWKVPDPRAKRDVLGVGAFNLVRREAFEVVGGFAAEPLAIVEDLRLGERMKAAGMRAGVAFGPGLVQVHWAGGALGIVRTVTKNFFAVLQYRLLAVVGAIVVVLALFWVPLLGLLVPGARLPALLAVATAAVQFTRGSRRTGVSGWYGLLSPLGALGVVFSILLSAWRTLRADGILWRGTFYPLADLRRPR